MFYSYVKLALKVLLRRKFFTAISLFGIALTLTVALIGTALFDHMVAPIAPEVNLDRTLHAGAFYLEVAKGDSVRSTSTGRMWRRPSESITWTTSLAAGSIGLSE